MVGLATAWQAATAASNMQWYSGLLKPTFAPPPWLAGLALVLLAATLSRALFRVWSTPDYLPDRPLALRLFFLALSLDAVWSWLFFGGRHPSVALVAAAALALAAALTVWRVAIVDRRAGLILVPWMLATGFVFLIDLSIALRNG